MDIYGKLLTNIYFQRFYYNNKMTEIQQPELLPGVEIQLTSKFPVFQVRLTCTRHKGPRDDTASAWAQQYSKAIVVPQELVG